VAAQQIDCIGIGRIKPFTPVKQKDHEIGFAHRQASVRLHMCSDGIGLVQVEPTSIYQYEWDAVPVRFSEIAVTRDPWGVVYHGFLLTEETIKQGGFPCVWSTDDGDDWETTKNRRRL
jgi:hypothetical protein